MICNMTEDTAAAFLAIAMIALLFAIVSAAQFMPDWMFRTDSTDGSNTD